MSRPEQSFVEAYNVRRFDGAGNGGGAGSSILRRPQLSSNVSINALATYKQPSSSAGLGRGFRGSPGVGPSARGYVGDSSYSYSLIRSDIEIEEDEKKSVDTRSLPTMPNQEFRVRHHTLQNLAFFGGTGLDPDEVYQKPMSWVEQPWFHGLSGLVIFINAIIIGLETDVDTPIWFWVEQLLLVFFVFELLSRLAWHGCHFFQHEEDYVWNIFDFSIVMSGVFDQWLMPLVTLVGMVTADRGRMSVVFMLMRMARLLRIVRLFRLVRIVRPLYELAQGVLEALQGMFWVLVFMVMTLYSVAILCTRLIGHGDLISEEMADDHEIRRIQDMFTTVEESMFTLFGTMSSWSLMKFVPLFEEMPVLRPLFVLFYVYSAWALLAVMTGVVSENMIAIREQMIKEDEHRDEVRKMMVTKTLMELFREADTDNSGTVSREEFNSMLRSPELIKKLQKNTSMKPEDLAELFEWLDHDGVGTITIEQFMRGFKWVNEPLRAKSLVKLQERLANELKNLESSVTSVVEKRVGEVQKLVAAPLRKVHAITEQLQSLDVHFGDLRAGLQLDLITAPSEQLQDLEDRLNSKIDAVVSRLDAIERSVRGPAPRSNSWK